MTVTVFIQLTEFQLLTLIAYVFIHPIIDIFLESKHVIRKEIRHDGLEY